MKWQGGSIVDKVYGILSDCHALIETAMTLLIQTD